MLKEFGNMNNSAKGNHSPTGIVTYRNEQRDIAEQKVDAGQEAETLTGYRLVIVFIATMLSVFLVALDQTLLSVAQTTIATSLGAGAQISWIVTAYFFTQAAFMLVFGQLLTMWPSKWFV